MGLPEVVARDKGKSIKSGKQKDLELLNLITDTKVCAAIKTTFRENYFPK